MFNCRIKKIRIMFELFPRVNFNRFQQGCSKLKTLVEFHSLENRSQSKLSYSKYFKCVMYFVMLCGKGQNSKQALLFTALKKSVANGGKLQLTPVAPAI